LRHGAVRISGQFDAPVVHHAGAADLHLAGKIEDGSAIDDSAPGFVGCKDWGAGDAETVMETVERFGRLAPRSRVPVTSLVLLGDLLSVYLAVLRGVDPTPVVMIDRLKSALAHG